MNHFHKIIIGLVGILCCSKPLISQPNPDLKRTYHWYFGDKAGLDFTSGNPVVDLNSQMYERETGSVISDNSGNLLFYTSGDTVWNRNHIIMPNGTGMLNCLSSTQGGLIVKKPENNNLYYIFTNDCSENSGILGVHYSIVDMSLDGGLGDVTTKNVLLYAPSTEKLATVYHCNQQDIWLVGQVRNSNQFCSYLINGTGVSNTPIISSIGFFHNDALQYTGHLKFSPNGRKMATVYLAIPGVEELFDFDNNTGIVSNFISLPSDTGEYGVSFSPDNSKLYIQSDGFVDKIFQYDLSSGTPSIIIASRSLIFNPPSNSTILGLQLAPNGKIYCSNYSHDSIDVINSPNVLGLGCNYVHNAMGLQGRVCEENLPQYIESYLNPVVSQTNCITNLGSFDFENNISSYPNPVNNVLHVKSDEIIIEVELFSVLGTSDFPELLFKDHQYSVDLSNQPDGMYNLKFKTNSKTIAKTIIINHN